MSIINPVKFYLREFYNVTYYNNRTRLSIDSDRIIFLHDDDEDFSNTERVEIGSVFGTKVVLCWGKIKTITGIDYRHKDFNQELIHFFREVITDNKTLDFLRILLHEDILVTIPINEILDEFPLLKE